MEPETKDASESPQSSDFDWKREDMEDFLHRKYISTKRHARVHFLSELEYRRRHRTWVILSILFSTALTGTVFSNASYPIFNGVFSLINGIVSGVMVALNYDSKAQAHAHAAKAYKRISNELNMTQRMKKFQNEDILRVTLELDHIDDDSPNILSKFDYPGIRDAKDAKKRGIIHSFLCFIGLKETDPDVVSDNIV